MLEGEGRFVNRLYGGGWLTTVECNGRRLGSPLRVESGRREMMLEGEGRFANRPYGGGDRWVPSPREPKTGRTKRD